MSAAGVLGGVLGLALLEAVVSSKASTDRAAGVFGMFAQTVNRILSPSIAAIPDLRKHKPAASTSSAQQVSATLPPDWTTGTAGGTAIPTSVTALQV